MNLLLDPGIIPFADIKDSLKRFSLANNLYIINKKVDTENWRKNHDGFHFLSYNSLEKIDNQSLQPDIASKYNDVLFCIINDHRTLLIAERVSKKQRPGATFHNILLVEKIVYNSINLLTKLEIDTLFFQATPHGLFEWVIAKTAELLKIKVLMIQTSPLPWRYWLVEGLDKQMVFNFLQKEPQKKHENTLTEMFLKTNLSNYSEAIPDYEKKRIESRGNKYWSWSKEIKDVIKAPGMIKFLFQKRRLFNHYNSLCTQNIYQNKNYISLFLHFQPERTSLPEGKNFAQQWLIIKTLSMSLPENWTLLVKEHPSIFTGKFSRKYRTESFYSDVNKLENVQLLPLEFNTFNLIDSSKAVATITGTVGIQSLIRGTPVLVFGHASYRNAKGVFNVSTIMEVKNAISEILKTEKEELIKNTKDFLNNISTKSFSPIDFEINPDESAFFNKENRIRGHAILIKSFLEHFGNKKS